MLLLIGVPVATLSARFLENSKNLSFISCSFLFCIEIWTTKGNTMHATPKPTKNANKLNSFFHIKNTNATATIIDPKLIPIQCILFSSILIARLLYMQYSEEYYIYQRYR